MNRLVNCYSFLSNLLFRCWIALLLCYGSVVHSLDKLSFYTEEYPPINFTQDNKLTGLSVDLLVAVFKHLKVPLTQKDIKVVPWARGYRAITQGPNAVLFAATRTKQREPLFKWAGPIIDSRDVLLARSDSLIKINDPKDIARYKIGVVKNDTGDQNVRALGFVPESQLQTQSSALVIIKLLQRKRVDMIAYELNSLRYQIKGLGLNNDEFTEAHLFSKGQLYYAFSKDVEDSLISQVQNAIDALKANGEYQKIISNYR